MLKALLGGFANDEAFPYLPSARDDQNGAFFILVIVVQCFLYLPEKHDLSPSKLSSS